MKILQKKSQVAQEIKNYVALMKRQHGVKIKKIFSDQGGEFKNNVLTGFYEKHGIVQVVTASFSPMSNGLAEQQNASLMGKVRPMLLQTGLPDVFWGEAVLHAAYLKNRTCSKLLDGLTPHEALSGEVPDNSHLRIFGSQVQVVVPTAKLKKIQKLARSISATK